VQAFYGEADKTDRQINGSLEVHADSDNAPMGAIYPLSRYLIAVDSILKSA
jgi:hypothetical protein